jgi:hypothetical protein
VKGIRPQDEIEAMLAAQMAAVHLATMTFARYLWPLFWLFMFKVSALNQTLF